MPPPPPGEEGADKTVCSCLGDAGGRAEGKFNGDTRAREVDDDPPRRGVMASGLMGRKEGAELDPHSLKLDVVVAVKAVEEGFESISTTDTKGLVKLLLLELLLLAAPGVLDMGVTPSVAGELASAKARRRCESARR